VTPPRARLSWCQARGHVRFGPAQRAAVALAAAAAAACALAGTARAQALDCPATPLEERIAASEAAFVGRLVSQRPSADGRTAYTFVVDQRVKGPIGREVEVRGEELSDANGTPLARDTAVGVLADRDGAVWETASCSLTDAGALLSAADEPKGEWIKLLIGLVILALVLAYSVRRLRRRRLELAARSGRRLPAAPREPPEAGSR
jgi:hypothetical protein